MRALPPSRSCQAGDFVVFQLQGIGGLDLPLAVSNVLCEEYGERSKLSPVLIIGIYRRRHPILGCQKPLWPISKANCLYLKAPIGHRRILCMVEASPQSLPSYWQKWVLPNGSDTCRFDDLFAACHLLPSKVLWTSKYKRDRQLRIKMKNEIRNDVWKILGSNLGKRPVSKIWCKPYS